MAYIAKIFSENGYEMVGYDYKGFGYSEGERGLIDNTANFINDGLVFIDKVKEFMET